MDSRGIIGQFGGYRQTLAFGYICLVYHATTLFCRRNYDHRNDPLGKSSGQMVGAARSARQNVVEASARAGTSKEQELRQLDVAKGSLDELAGDYEAFIIDAGEVPWSMSDPKAIELAQLKIDAFTEREDLPHTHGLYIQAMRKRFEPWLESGDAITAANAILLTIRRASALLFNMMQRKAVAATEQPDFPERVSKARMKARIETEAEPGAPRCPKCGGPMRKRVAKRGKNAGGEFWSCCAYPKCMGAVAIG